ncbi:diguanylate cyclase [Nostoc sp. CENA67]|uniref:Diguanylate cyclase n=1 Tax=Amazonocrinis nigriterrae CENA67 TaxID=2794033 RepID=A0A8J7LC01_9NOST|nr:diguanylate cyclase [Amazonocrinis nigriterrae]MBH8564171.1 diguanylate cyclase [Amazonocrinis nigriterrae CENA67]
MNLSSDKQKTQTIRLLVVEDEYILAMNLQENLESLGYTVIEIADSAETAIVKATELRPSLILMDICLQGKMDGIQAAEQIWSSLKIPSIYVTGYSDVSTVERATLTFPFGYILKPVRERELYVAIKTALNRYEREQFLSSMLEEMKDKLITVDGELSIDTIHQSMLYKQMQAANLELQRLVNLDDLTQIANRRRFDECLHAEWHRLKREQMPLSLILCDIDFFKRYNDTYGHLAGDDCLRQVATALKSVVQRPADLIARYGGEEFVVILPNTKHQGAIHVARTILQAVRNLAIPHAESSVSKHVTISVGVVSIIPNLDLSPQDLMAAADKALYAAKQQGRDRVISFQFNHSQ